MQWDGRVRSTDPVCPCGPPESTKSLELLPDIGWASAIPFRLGDVNMDIQGSSLHFTDLA
uniref:Uncharacterized protein n=1 Tax=Coccidioides posadasii RMSCC 3488 TaxID=454284 RepID=A0A0J6FDP4_COCPO|nr:hypothetical protein CPAG_07528 [Coccidioides posadasii RMSCC 3488]